MYWVDIQLAQQKGLKFYQTRCDAIIFYDILPAYCNPKVVVIELWRIKDHLLKHFLYCHHWFDEKVEKSRARGGGHKKRDQYCTDSSGAILYLRALQGHSGRNLIDPSLQDNLIIQSNFFQYIYHVGCAINLHSIINSGLIPGDQNLRNRQTVFFLPVDPMEKNHKDPDTIDLSVPRHAIYMHEAWKRHQDAVY